MIDTKQIVEGTCEWLDAQGLATYKPGGVYAANDKAATIKRLPSYPDNAVAVSLYSTQDATVLPNATVRIQLRFRAAKGSRTAVDEWADEVASHLHWKRNLTLGAVKVARAERINTAPMGADDNGREERADNYELILLTH